MPIFSLIQRDLRMRIYYGRAQCFIQMALFLLITVFFVIAFELNHLSQDAEWISVGRFWDGFSEMDLESFKQSGTFHIPYLWLFFQLLYFLSLRTFFLIDLTSNSGMIILRTGVKKFVAGKAISLFLYTWLYVSVLMVFIIFVSTIQFFIYHVHLSWVSHWLVSITFYIFLIISLFLEALIFEFISIFLGEVIGFLSLFSFNFLSIFSKNILLVGNYTMFSRWSESTRFRDNILFVQAWLIVLMIAVLVMEIIALSKMDLINEKGEK
mgnify:CR=1 FL=1